MKYLIQRNEEDVIFKKKKSCINLGLLSENCIYTIGIFYCLFENFVQMSECHFVKQKKGTGINLKNIYRLDVHV